MDKLWAILGYYLEMKINNEFHGIMKVWLEGVRVHPNVKAAILSLLDKLGLMQKQSLHIKCWS